MGAALAQTHSLLVKESCGGGSQDGCQVWRGAQAQPCSACPKQPVHEPEPSAVDFAYILAWCSASSSLYHPWKETNPPVHTPATKPASSAGRTLQLLFRFSSEKTKDSTSLKHISKQYHLSQTLLWAPATLLSADWFLCFFLSVWINSIN